MLNGVALAILCFASTLCAAEQCPPSAHDYKDPPLVCTFFEPFEFHAPELADDYLKILKIWDASWRRHGWQTLILTKKDAELHPRYKEVSLDLDNLPTINDRIYDGWLQFKLDAVLFPSPTPFDF